MERDVDAVATVYPGQMTDEDYAFIVQGFVYSSFVAQCARAVGVR